VQITTSWPGGYQALATVHNTGARLNPWLVTWTLPAGATVTAGWNAAVTQAGQQVSAAAPSWNPSLATGDSVSIGFNVSGSSNPPPGDVRLGGTACQG
jgi:endoglucanase